MIYVKKFSSSSERLQDSHDLFRVHLLFATVKQGAISHQFNGKICSDQVWLYFLLQGQRKRRQPSTKRHAQLGSGSLTT